MQQYSGRLLGQRVGLSAWRHVAIAISNRYLNKAFGDDVGEDGEFDEDEEGTLDNIWDLQAAHTTHVAGLVYARELQQGPSGTAARRDQFRSASRSWHRFFGFGAEDQARGAAVAGRKRKPDVFDSIREEARFRRFARLQQVGIQGQLRVMMGPEAQFRGMQEQVIRAVVRGESPIVQVAGTGEGKSISFMLPAFCSPDGVTVVVVPLVALRDDLSSRCERHGIEAHVWQRQGPNRAAAIVFVTPESAVTEGFRTFINRLQARGQLDRVFVDECHTVLDSDRGFRPQMGELGGALQEMGVQVVFLTATLAPADVGEFYAKMRLDGRRVRLFRSRTIRR
ncbi:ATP-dependent DNA helicase, partial [Staphylotrichum tortipilum]